MVFRENQCFHGEVCDLEKGEEASSSEEHGTDASEGSTTANGGRLGRARSGLRWLSRRGSGDGAVGTTPSRAVARARGNNGGLSSLGRGLSDNRLGGGCRLRAGKRGADDVDGCRGGLQGRGGGRSSSGSSNGGSSGGGHELLGLEAVLNAIRLGTLSKIHRFRAAPGLGLGVMRAVVTRITRV